jgi:hypothetical protein
VGLGLTLFIIPDVAANLVGLEPHKDVWLYVSAMTILVQSVYFIVSARSESTNFYRASVPLRYLAPVFFATFAALNLKKFAILLFTPLDVSFATWTALALCGSSSQRFGAQVTYGLSRRSFTGSSSGRP